ncbi:MULTISPECIES: ATP-binding protein [Hyphomicrobium]|jgi:two-component system sensor histidine kinase UhpB|uniref:ATP-binding protein n=1 Tax=Hyphomicrobium TaxID=81 RepID=UPI0003672519|nr:MULTISPECIES: ATP-binding protein [Hyphomicrobium]WBT37587.1 histidine kinase [Hyphomicrobium sp. DMF-1]HML42082.1 histidine kinase [Hyphomicrobium zavarzinii]
MPMREYIDLNGSLGPKKSESLSATIIRNISIVLILTLVMSGAITYWQAANKVETEVGAALSIAEKTVRKVVQEIAHDDEPRLQLVRLVRVFDGNRHVRATFIEPEPIGARISSFVAPAEELPDWFYALMAGPPQVIRIALPEGLTNYGAFELETEQRGEVGEVWDDFLLKLAILTFFCALVSTLVYFTVGRALEPLPKLSAAFERLGGGDYGVRVAESGPTELAKLCSGFNEMADRLGQMERRNQQLNEQLATVQEEERADLARDLHDEVSPFLFSVDVDASTIRQMAEAPETDALIARTDAIREAVAHMKKHVKSILGRLRPTVHLELGLANAIETLVASWQLRNPDVVFNVDVTDRGCGQKLDAVIHGIVREAISNAFKHSKPTEIDVQVTRNEDDDVRVLVRDDGGGLKPSSLSSGFGLIAMRERVTALGGTIDIGNREDRAGVKVDVRLPIRESYAAFDGSADLGSDA